MSYSVSLPEAQQNGSPNVTVDFKMSFERRKLVCGSVRLSGLLTTKLNGNTIAVDDNVFYDGLIGADNWIQSVKTQFNGRTMENIEHYPRIVRMESDAMNDPTDMMNSDNYTALKMPFNERTNLVLRGPNDNGQIDFYSRPSFLLNKAFAKDGREPYLSFEQSGTVMVSFTYADLIKCFFGDDADNTLTYSFSDLKLHYLTVPDDGQRQKIVFRTKYCVPQAIESSNASIDTNIPGMLVRSASMSFIRQDRASKYLHNSHATEPLPNVRRVTFLFNDTNNNKISFPLDSREEILSNYIQSFTDTGSNGLTPRRISYDSSYGIGLDFGAPQDFSSQKFNVIIDSDVSNTNPYNVYIFFHGFLQLE